MDLITGISVNRDHVSQESSLSVKSNIGVKVFVDRRRVRNSQIGDLALPEGYHEVLIRKEDNDMSIYRQNIYFNSGKRTTFGYDYASKNDAVVKSLLLPGLGHFYYERSKSGILYTTAVLAGIGLISYGGYDYLQQTDKFNDYKDLISSCTLYDEKLKYAKKANSTRDNIKMANNMIVAGAAVTVVTYIASFLDIYFTEAEHILSIDGYYEGLAENLTFDGNKITFTVPINSSINYGAKGQ